MNVPFVSCAHYDFTAYAKYVSFYIPANPYSVTLCSALISEQSLPLVATGGGNIRVPSTRLFHGGLHFGNFGEDKTPTVKGDILSEEVEGKTKPENYLDSQELTYTKRIYFYMEDEVTDEEVLSLRHQSESVGTSIIFRGKNYVRQRMLREQPLAFISHDSNDKNDIARPLAIKLNSMFCPVWYDEFTLKVGDSLRESIEKGLKECKKCILILSPHFLANPGWTKVEFNSIFTREILETKNLILPIWHGVTQKQVYEYSPSLADRVADQSSLGIEELARRMYNAVEP